MKTYIGNLSANNAKLDDIRTRIKYIEQLFKEFVTVEEKIFGINKEDQSQHDHLEEVYYEVLAGLNEWERNLSITIGAIDTSLNETSGVHRNIVPDVKLPGLKVPKFNGDYTEWQTFYQLFTTTIHNSTHLHPVQKYQFLVNSLGDEPARLIRHMDITETNYILALNKLKERYDRKRHVVNKFIQMFLNQPAITKSTAQDLRKIYDVSAEVIRTLQGLGNEANGRDVWLLYILVAKLDDSTRTSWMQHSVESDFPSLDSFLKFIVNRADALEYQCKVEEKPRSSNAISSSRPHMKALTTVNVQCPICTTSDHPIYKCQKFREMSIEKRREAIRNENRCYNCFSSKHSARDCRSYRRCQYCKRRHHSLIHDSDHTMSSKSTPQTNVLNNLVGPEPSIDSTPESTSVTVTLTDTGTNICGSSINVSVLPTALVQIQDRIGKWQGCRVLLDSGAEVSFITEECVQRLGLSRQAAKIDIRGLAYQSVGQTRGRTQLVLRPHFASEFATNINAYVTHHITSTRAPAVVDSSILRVLNGEVMADPSSATVTRIDVLIGIDHFWALLSDGQLKIDDKVLAQNSKLGWIMAGTFTAKQATSVMSLSCDENMDQMLTKFWESEELDKDEKFGELNFCEEHFLHNHSRNERGRFIVKLPVKANPPPMGNSYEIAKVRLLSMERKFKRNPQFYQLYRTFMEEYKKLDHMTLVPKPVDKVVVYLPHHGILKESSTTTKLRVVFDASAQTSNGIAVNNILEVGPPIQRSLYQILVNFRKNRIAFTADIEKMYRQILVHPDDRRYQRILWRDSIDDPIQQYELNTVTYDMAPSSFLATRVLQAVADDYQDQHPEASKIILNNMYMDDVMSGANSVGDAIRLSQEIDTILSSAGFNLRKWGSNSQQFLQAVTNTNGRFQSPVDLQSTEIAQVLGLQWMPDTDVFTYHIQLDPKPSFTKRRMLAEFSRVFDPLGLLAPFIIKIKIMFQQLWLLKLTWDEPLPPTIQQKWSSLREEIPNIRSLRINRWIGLIDGNATIHGFSDARERAYAAVVYVCSKEEETVSVQLITAKTRVAPTNTVSLVRLELCGALLLAKLMKQIGAILEISRENMVAWTDSSIVLDWLSDIPQRWKTNVANRTSKILNVLPRAHWHHVPSELNPADCATRGLSPRQLENCQLWWHGPNYLLVGSDQWPKFDRHGTRNLIERRSCLVVSSSNRAKEVEFIYEVQQRYYGFSKMIMVLAYVYRIVGTLTKRRTKGKERLTREEMIQTTLKVQRAIQLRHFLVEIIHLQTGRRIPRESKLVSLDPFLDEAGTLRVGGRIHNAPVEFDQRHPIILPNHDPIVKKLMTEQHIKNFHCGPSYLLHLLRQKYWILGIRGTIRGIFRTCVQCIRQNPTSASQKMGMLTRERVELVKPFLRSGVDFAGPIRTVLIHGCGQRIRKTYICLFVCMCTKAIHVEVTSDLSTAAFLAAFDRFIGRRGTCTDLYSDNGSNFRGAKRVFDELNQFILTNRNLMASQVLRNHKTNWHFIPVQRPHFGGLWEAGVKSVKTHLQRVTGDKIVSNDELYTLLVQIESMLNNRPLYSHGPELQDVLTPAHYLVGTQTIALINPDVTKIAYNRLSHWQAIQKMIQLIWRRWYKEYINSLQQRVKWQQDEANLQIGQIVLIKEENPLLNNWRMGKIIQLHTGADGRVRLVTLKTMDGEIQRAVQKLCPLPLQEMNGGNLSAQ